MHLFFTTLKSYIFERNKTLISKHIFSEYSFILARFMLCVAFLYWDRWKETWKCHTHKTADRKPSSLRRWLLGTLWCRLYEIHKYCQQIMLVPICTQSQNKLKYKRIPCKFGRNRCLREAFKNKIRKIYSFAHSWLLVVLLSGGHLFTSVPVHQ